jgi:hypothetical protein
MPELPIHEGKARCPQCGKDVSVLAHGRFNEKPGEQYSVQLKYVLLGDCGHVVGERNTPSEAWQVAT